MKKLLFALLVTATSTFTFAQDASPNPFEVASGFITCFGKTEPVQVVVALDAAKAPTAAVYLVMDPQTGDVAGGANLTVSSATYDAATLNVDAAVEGNASITLNVSSTYAQDMTFQDESGADVTVPTYEGTMTMSDGSQAESTDVVCGVE